MTETKKKRVVNKDGHRAAILEATAWAIRHYGLSGTTTRRILDRAQLSSGMIHLHFATKDNLFIELAAEMNQKYEQNWRRHLEQAGDDPAARLNALFAADFAEESLNETFSSVFMAFRVESNVRAAMMPGIETRDAKLGAAYLACCRDLCRQGGYDVDPAQAAEVFLHLLEGLLMDFHLHPDNFDRQKAVGLCRTVARGFFPDHF